MAFSFILVSANQGKAREFNAHEWFSSHKIQTYADVFGHPPVVNETGTTFEENATLKAIYPPYNPNYYTLGEDSGLVIPALEGRPGVYSARYGGQHLNDADRNALILDEMATITNRKAYFMTALCIRLSDDETRTYTGTCHGHIAREASGNQGFGYDPIFVPTPLTSTFGTLPLSTKQHYSHRAKAIQALGRGLSHLHAEAVEKKTIN